MSKKQNLVSFTLDPQQLQQWNQNILGMANALPRVPLTKEDRRELIKPGLEKLETFPVLAQAQAKYPAYFPTEVFDGTELMRDIQLVRDLQPIYDSVSILQQILGDLLLAAQSDAYRNSLKGYSLAKIAVGMEPGMSSAIERLTNQFDRKRRPTEPTSEAGE